MNARGWQAEDDVSLPDVFAGDDVFAIHDADSKSIEALLRRLEEKISIGELLELKAKGQNSKLAESAVEADEAYTYDWALNPAEVSRLLTA